MLAIKTFNFFLDLGEYMNVGVMRNHNIHFFALYYVIITHNFYKILFYNSYDIWLLIYILLQDQFCSFLLFVWYVKWKLNGIRVLIEVQLLLVHKNCIWLVSIAGIASLPSIMLHCHTKPTDFCNPSSALNWLTRELAILMASNAFLSAGNKSTKHVLKRRKVLFTTSVGDKWAWSYVKWHWGGVLLHIITFPVLVFR